MDMNESMQCLVAMRAHEGRDRSSMGLTYSLVRVSRIKIEASQIGIMVVMRKIFDDGDYGLEVEDGGNYKSNYLFGQKRQRRWREAKLKSFEPRRDIAPVYEDHTKVGESGDGITGTWRKALKHRRTPPLTDSLS